MSIKSQVNCTYIRLKRGWSTFPRIFRSPPHLARRVSHPPATASGPALAPACRKPPRAPAGPASAGPATARHPALRSSHNRSASEGSGMRQIKPLPLLGPPQLRLANLTTASRYLAPAGGRPPGQRAWKHGLHPEVETDHSFSGFHTKPGDPDRLCRVPCGKAGSGLSPRRPGSARESSPCWLRSASRRLRQTAPQAPCHQIHHLVDIWRVGQNGILLPREPVAQIVRSEPQERFIFVPAFGPFLGLLQ